MTLGFWKERFVVLVLVGVYAEHRKKANCMGLNWVFSGERQVLKRRMRKSERRRYKARKDREREYNNRTIHCVNTVDSSQ